MRDSILSDAIVEHIGLLIATAKPSASSDLPVDVSLISF
jgi:hypothetical protein